MAPDDPISDQPAAERSAGATTTAPRPGEQTGGVPPLPPLPPLPPPVPPGTGGRWQRTPVARDPAAGRVAGVIAGLSRSYGFDVRTTRIAVLVATIVLPVLIVVYAAAWLLLPERPEQATPLADVVRDRRRMPLLIALGIVAVAGGIGSFGSWFLFGGLPWGLGLIVIGVLLWAAPNLVADRGDRRDRGDTAAGPGPAMPSSPAPGPLPADAPWSAPHVPGDAAAPGAIGVTPPTPPATPLPPTLPPTPPKARYPIDAIGFTAAMSFVLVAAGGDALDWWDLPILHGAFVVLAILWGSHLLSGIVNRRWSVVPGLLFLGVLATGLMITRPNLEGGIGEKTVRPLTAAEAQVDHRLGIGQLTLDLTGIEDLDTVDEITIDAEVGAGRLHVRVPDGAVLELRSRVGAGHIVLDDDEIAAGLDHHHDRRVPAAAPVSAGRGDAANVDEPPTIVLEVEVGLGEIDVDRVRR